MVLLKNTAEHIHYGNRIFIEKMIKLKYSMNKLVLKLEPVNPHFKTALTKAKLDRRRGTLTPLFVLKYSLFYLLGQN